MELRIIGHATVASLLTMAECIEAMEAAFRTLGRGEAVMPRRQIMWLPEKKGALACMPSFMKSLDMIGLKAITAFPGNHGSEFPAHQGMVMLFDGSHGRPVAIVDAGEITAVRTAAVSGLATRLLAREDADDLVLIGSGVQARTHLEAMLTVRDIKRVRVWNPFPHLAEAFAKREGQRFSIDIEACQGARPELEGADIICTVTSSTEPVLFGNDVPLGAHINAVGSSFPHARELDSETIVKSKVFVDLRESTLNEAGDFLFPLKEGLVTEEHIKGELGDVLLGKAIGRQTEEEITLFESLGVAVEDLGAAEWVYRKATELQKGTLVQL